MDGFTIEHPPKEEVTRLLFLSTLQFFIHAIVLVSLECSFYGSFCGLFDGRSSISLEQPPGHTPKTEWYCDVESEFESSTKN